VFTSQTGQPLDGANVRRAFRSITKRAGLGEGWTPRELRHSFVSIMSDTGVPIETIADLAGHASISVTETVYRHQLKPVITRGAETMHTIFAEHAGNEVRVMHWLPDWLRQPEQPEKGHVREASKPCLTCWNS
jgi:hypothetical protein